MTAINIFIASSLELSQQRVLIGDYIRRLSYDYSPRGVRLRMLCWEDFYPEYSGVSKQKEYDDSLIATCDIFIAIFRKRCGKYTRHEIELAQKLNKECHILVLPSAEEHDDLDQYLSTATIAPQPCDEANLLTEINMVIDNYMSANDIKLSSTATPLKTWRLYATIPDDLEHLRIPFSNMIRSFEYSLEGPLGCYFSLYPYHTPENIASTEHYICLLQDTWSKHDEHEVETAYTLRNKYKLPQTALLYHAEGHTGINNNPLAIKINSEYEGFSKSYSNIDTITSDLYNWVFRHMNSTLFNAAQIFSVEGDMIYCYGRPFFHLSIYPQLHTSITYINSSIAKIDEKIKRNIKDGRVKDEDTAIKLARQRKDKEQQLQSTINNWFNKIQLLQSLHLHASQSPLEPVKAEHHAKYTRLSHEIESLAGQCPNSDKQFLANLATLLLEWEDAASINLSTGIIQVHDYIQVLRRIVQVCDTYLHPCGIPFDEDAIFKKIIDAADKYNYHTLFTEVMRVNYANSFGKDLEYDKADIHYRSACRNILEIEDDTVIAHRYKSYVIMSLLCHFSEIDDKDAVFALGKQYEALIHHWQTINPHTNYDVDLARCYSFVLNAAPKCYGVCKELADRSETLIQKLHRQFDGKPFDKDYFDAICYFNIVLSAYFIDRYEKGNDEYFNKALHYIKESQKSLEACYPYEPEYISQSLAQPYHNRGFLYSKAGDWEKTISNYKTALKKREALYNKDLGDGTLFEVAQTLVNLGEAYSITKQFDKALECADRAISIYGSKRGTGLQVFDMYYYEAYQLKATILLDIDEENGKYPAEALRMMHECMDWSRNHQGNDYEDRFNEVSGITLCEYRSK